MTKTVTLVNTSNHTNENLSICVQEEGCDTTLQAIEPGGSLRVGVDDKVVITITKTHAKPEDIQPYYLNGKQVWPEVYVGFSGARGILG